jgi:hypothetical protein
MMAPEPWGGTYHTSDPADVERMEAKGWTVYRTNPIPEQYWPETWKERT